MPVTFRRRVPAFSTVRVSLKETQPAKDGEGYYAINGGFGLAFKGEDSGKTVSKPAALSEFYQEKWISTHRILRTAPNNASRDWHYFFIATPTDIVSVLQPKS